jgi:hypothetical protein
LAQRQINIRIPEEDALVLDAASFLNGGSVAENARATLLAEVEALRKRPRIRAMLRLWAEEAAEEQGVLSALPDRQGGGEHG